MPKSTLSGEEALRLNCGASGWDYTDPRGNFWLKDEEFVPLNRWGYTQGTPRDYQTTLTIPSGLTDIAPVYLTVRSGGTSMKYEMDMPNGRYQVVLHFIEPFFTAANKRVFDVAVQGAVVLDDLDVFSRAGGMVRPFSQTVTADVANEKLTITFPEIKKDVAIISGIEVKVQSVSDEDFLSFLQKKMFAYFWTEVGPTTGLISDKSNNWLDQDFPVASIATTGFGLSILTAAVERGWITSAQARQRIHTTLDYFRQMQLDPNKSYHGLWYHFVNWTTGAREWGSEISTVDSALFIMGALQTGEYFRSVDPTIAQKAEQMFKDMQWDWFAGRAGGTSPFLSMGWKPIFEGGNATIPAPDKGYFIQYFWDNYNESVFVNLMAMGSPTHPVSTRVWTEMRRHHVGSTSDGYSEYMHFPPLFGHQYHNLYFDFRNKHDGMSDYWDAAVRATKKDRAQCAADPLFEPDIWGLTACELPGGGYEAFGTNPWGKSWGIAAPTGPMASLPMTPRESIASGRKMFFQYKHAIWGRHGFADSFSLSDNSRTENVLGLDNGPIVLAIENYRSNKIRETFMQNPYVVAALTRAGFMATDAGPRYFAHSEKNNNRAENAFDGSPATGWESTGEDNQWLAVDFGKLTSINHVRLSWGSVHGKTYDIETSNDGDTWTSVGTMVNGDGGEDILRFARTTARMGRWRGSQRNITAGGAGYVLNSFVFEDDSPPTVAPAVPSSVRVTHRGVDRLVWEWNDNSDNETGFRVKRALDNTVLVDGLAANTTYWVQTGLGGNQSESVRIEAFNSFGVGISPESNEIFTLANSPVDSTLKFTNGRWSLEWSANGNTDKTLYSIYRSVDEVSFARVYQGPQLDVPLAGVDLNKTYYFKVRAINSELIPSSFDLTVSTRIHTLNFEVQGPSPMLGLAPPFTVSFDRPSLSGETILLDPLDDWFGSRPKSWRPVKIPWSIANDSDNGPVINVGPIIPSGSGYVLAMWDGTTWVNQGLSAQTKGGVFGVFFNVPSTLESVRAYPNPLRRSSGDLIKFGPVPEGTQVEIFTVSGEKIRNLSIGVGESIIYWDGRNTSGDPVASGVYFGTICGGGEKKTFRLAVQ